jgi:hypothetical protein
LRFFPWNLEPWNKKMLDRLRSEVQDYFQAYYAELRRLIAEHDDSADIPGWFRGGREITTSACTDGVVVVHMPYDPESRAYPERADSYRFDLASARGYSVRDLVRESYSLTFPDTSKMEVMPEYAPGGDFGPFVRLWPAHVVRPFFPDEREMNEVMSHWTRLDAASMSNLDLWRDNEVARRQAWEALRPYVEGEDVPVPRLE